MRRGPTTANGKNWDSRTGRVGQEASCTTFVLMLMAYIDETGDPGDPAKKGSSNCYGLGCVLISSGDWSAGFDSLAHFRRELRDDFGIPIRQELKANYLIRNNGGLRPLGLAPAQRRLVYQYHLNQLASMKARAFAVVVDKQSVGNVDYLELAWETLVQRLERTTSKEKVDLLITHDEGENAAVRKLTRRARRHLTAGSFYGQGSLRNPFAHLLEDPVPRASHESYFLQLADLVAYAGWRTYMQPGPGAAQVVDAQTWTGLGTACHKAVNGLAGNGTPGVVIRK